MNIYDSLKFDHLEVERILSLLFEALDRNDPFAATLLAQLRRVVITHAHAEEAVFYNALRSIDVSTDTIMHSYGEHAKVELVLRATSASRLRDEKTKARLRKAAEDLRSHIHDEEGKVFDAARNVLTDEEADLLGNAFQRASAIIGKHAPSVLRTGIDIITNLLPPRFTASYREGFDEMHSHAKAA